jgi:arylsulfatase A-like enzyme
LPASGIIFAAVLAWLLAAGGACERAAAPAAAAPAADPGAAILAPAAPDGPDVILISVDALRADRLGAYGYRRHPSSPRIDALAAEGVLFENAVAASPWTTPAHASMLTGLHPSTHGVTASFRELKRDLLEGRGYVRLPEARLTLAEALKAAGMGTWAWTAGGTLDPSIGFGQGFDSYDTSMHKLDEAVMAPLFGRVSGARGRFFLFWHNFEVHAPYLDGRFLGGEVGDADREAIRDGLARLEALPGAYRAMGERPRSQRQGQRELLESRGAFRPEVCEALYVGGIRSFDDWLGRFLDLLKARGRYDGALIVLTSDHGEEFGERDGGRFYDAHGHSVHREQVHVPLIWKLPGGAHAGRRVPAVVRTVDLMPTLLDVLGIRAEGAAMDGRSLRPLWEAAADGEALPAVSESLATLEEHKALRHGRHKYVLRLSEAEVAAGGRRQVPATPTAEALFDLAVDPDERVNLLADGSDPESRAVADRLWRLLAGQVGTGGPAVERTTLDLEVVERLEALGYLGD